MAINEAYATPQQYRSGITKRDATGDEGLQDDLLAVSRYMDEELHRFYTKDDVAVARVYDTPFFGYLNAEAENPWRGLRGTPDLYVDDIADVAGLSIVVDANRDGSYVGETIFTANDYILLPRNAQVGPEARPYYCIRLTRYGNIANWMPATSVQVTAIWGWPAVPKAIERACIQLTAILRLETPRATSRVTELGETLKASKEACDILNGLQKAYKKQPRV